MPYTISGDKKGLTMFYNVMYREGRQLRWISHNQAKNDTDKYEFSMALECGKARDKGRFKSVAKFYGYCLPVDVNYDTIKKEMIGLNLTDEFIEKNADKDNKVTFEFFVNKVV